MSGIRDCGTRVGKTERKEKPFVVDWIHRATQAGLGGLLVSVLHK